MYLHLPSFKGTSGAQTWVLSDSRHIILHSDMYEKSESSFLSLKLYSSFKSVLQNQEITIMFFIL